jgi:hypothetical protein
LIIAYNGKPPWSTKPFVPTVHENEHHDVVSSGIDVDQFPDKHHREWRKQGIFTLEEAMEASMVEVISEFHC